MARQFYAYILASKRNGTPVCRSHVEPREARMGAQAGPHQWFYKEVRVKTIVHYEVHESPDAAIVREKQINEWERAWEIRLIEKSNPIWDDLYEKIVL